MKVLFILNVNRSRVIYEISKKEEISEVYFTRVPTDSCSTTVLEY